jgi:hypothetical protein
MRLTMRSRENSLTTMSGKGCLRRLLHHFPDDHDDHGYEGSGPLIHEVKLSFLPARMDGELREAA